MPETQQNDMKKKWNPWFWLAVFSTGSGMTLGLFVPLHDGDFELGDFAWPQILLRFFSFIAAAFIAAGLLFLIFKWSRRFLRRLFTWRVLKWCLLTLGILLALIPLFYAEENWRGRHAWEKYKQEWEAKGEKFDFASFIPPPVPDEQNFALTPIVVGSYGRFLDQNGHRLKSENANVVNRLEISIYPDFQSDNAPTNGDWERGQITDLKAWQAYYRTPLPPVSDKYRAINQFEIAPLPQLPAEDVLLAMRKFDSTIDELRLAGKLSCSRFPLNYDTNQVLNIIQCHLHALRNCADVLKMRAVAELDLGQSEKTLADVKLMLRLQDSIRNEPFMISQLVRARLLTITLQPVAEGLVKNKWSDSELLEIGRELERLDLLTDIQFASRGERASMLATMDYFRHERNYREYAGYPVNMFQWNYGTVLGAVGFHLIPSGWFYREELGIAKTNQQGAIQMVDATNHLAFPENEADPYLASDTVRPWKLFLAEALSFAPGHDERRIVYVQESLDMARVACALERWRLVFGEYPETLNALAPRFIKTIPHDIIGGQPLHYHPVDNGRFVLYSVGWNQKDEGGERMKMVNDYELDLGKGDWVWPFSAK
jgi:hypothetical protein